ncbi:MAG: efflux RND transporter periplasmic adaptor subunit [Parapedobacter sp.]|nr:MAG: efflux RND transporter periplasmic adaptor subunit [Parapedobacter sp.]
MNKNTKIMALCAVLIYISCTPKEEKNEQAHSFTVTTPLRVDTSMTKEYVSQIRSVRNIEIRAQEKGYLQNIYVDEGQFVKAGTLLFRIMPKLYEAELLKAQAEAEAATIELQNTQALADKNIVSKNELAMAQAKLSKANAEMALAKLHLSFTEVRAPFDGTIDRIPLKLGSLVDEGELLTSLSDNNDVFTYFNVSESEYLNYETDVENRGNALVRLLLANGQLFDQAGEIETIESEFDNETGNIAFRARFPNPKGLLKNGETGKVQLTIPLRDALIIPQKATYEIQDKMYVFVVGNDGVIRSKNITVAGEMPDLYVVDDGLSEKDKILLDGVQTAKDDDKIDCKFVAPKEAFASLQLKAE